MTAPKNIFTIFCFGMFFGIIISPFVNTKPQDILLSPTKNLFAQELMPQNNLQSKIPKSTDSYVNDLFASYDQEQNILIQNSQVLGASDVQTEDNLIKEKPIALLSGHKTIALFGDSMIDTMETDAPYLKKALKSSYPNIDFNLLNYGIGAQSVTKGLDRLNENINYKDRQYQAIFNSNADIFIIESFAYNPLDNSEEYETNMRSLLNQFVGLGKPVYFLATIAPLKVNFGKGPGGVNWDSDTAWTHATKIDSYLEKGISIARSLNIPVIDCYHPTLQTNGEGITIYVNKHDGIHPSVSGHQFIADKIAHMISI